MSKFTTTLTNEQQPRSPLVMKRLIACSRFPVYQASSTQTKNEYAVKIFPCEPSGSASFSQEHSVSSLLSHPNIIKYIAHRKTKVSGVPCNMLITEYAPYGDFFDLVMLKGLKDINELSKYYFHQLINGLEYMHSDRKIAHCDLKLENILIGKDYSLKIIDFDQSQSQAKSPFKLTSKLFGTEGYRAPEILEGQSRDLFALDIFAAGVLLYVFITGEMPFFECLQGDQRVMQGYDLFCNNNKEFWDRKVTRHHNTILVNKDLQDLLNGMLAQNSSERLNINQVKESKWMSNLIIDDEIVKKHSKRLFMQEQESQQI